MLANSKQSFENVQISDIQQDSVYRSKLVDSISEKKKNHQSMTFCKETSLFDFVCQSLTIVFSVIRQGLKEFTESLVEKMEPPFWHGDLIDR